METNRNVMINAERPPVNGYLGTYKKLGENIAFSHSPKVDRHGFVVSHRLHEKVSSTPDSTLSCDVGKRREIKWLEMIHNWDELMRKKNNKVKERCCKGIPQSVRSLAWQHLSGADILRKQNRGLYEKMLQESADTDWGCVIRKDIPRTFRHHSMFYDDNSQGQEDLYNVLVAFSCYDKETGYNQGLAPIAAVLLMHMPPEEAFWVLISICKYYLPGYYGEKMEAIRLDGLIFGELLEMVNPHISMHMQKNNIDPLMYIVEWMVCIYARCLPFETVLRIWDMFFCEGVKVLFKVGLAILKVVFPNSKALDGKDDYKTTQILINLPKQFVEENVLIPEALSMNITDKQFEKIHRKIIADHPELSVDRFREGSL